MLRLVCGRVESLAAAAARAAVWLPVEPLPPVASTEVEALLAFMHVSAWVHVLTCVAAESSASRCSAAEPLLSTSRRLQLTEPEAERALLPACLPGRTGLQAMFGHVERS